MKNLLNFKSFNEGIESIWASSIKNIGLEDKPGSNKGPLVQKMQNNVKANPGDPWCAAYVYTVFKEANLPKEIMEKIPKTAAVIELWKKSESNKKIKTISAEDASNNPELIKPGMVFCYLTRKPGEGSPVYPGSGHTGIIVSVDPTAKTWTGIEGNTNPLDGAREGFGTFLIKRSFSEPSISKDPQNKPTKLLGFIDFLDGHREQDLDGFEEELKKVIDKYTQFTNGEMSKIKKNPDLLNQYEENYKKRNES